MYSREGTVEPPHATVRVWLPDCKPEPVFFTDTVKLPALRVTGPTTCVAVSMVSVELATMHGLQFGPFTNISAVAGSKLLPLTVRLNCCIPTGGLGDVTRLLVVGAVAEIVIEN
jgi:hypothetical protein